MSSAEESGALALLAKARNDAVVLEKLGQDDEVADEIIGFHAQQTVEKALKAVLQARGVNYPHTHDLGRLLELLEASGGGPPEGEAALSLTPWAAQLRYGDAVSGSLDRPAAIAMAMSYLEWAEDEVPT